MFKNIGKKIRILAMVLCWIGIVSSILIGLLLILGGTIIPDQMNSLRVNGSYVSFGAGFFIVLGVIWMLLGSLFSWLGSFVLYGFGTLVEETQANSKRMEHLQNTLVGIATSADTKRDTIIHMMETFHGQQGNNPNRPRQPWHPPVSAPNPSADAQYRQGSAVGSAPAYQAPGYQAQQPYQKPYQAPAINPQDPDGTVAAGSNQM